jgi:hypothetical protein
VSGSAASAHVECLEVGVSRRERAVLGKPEDTKSSLLWLSPWLIPKARPEAVGKYYRPTVTSWYWLPRIQGPKTLSRKDFQPAPVGGTGTRRR